MADHKTDLRISLNTTETLNGGEKEVRRTSIYAKMMAR